ncbi:MAG TPA: hypothetical protein VLM75_00390 [Spirochaetota bacterium]|nr:hypothetical protein [Spirochaetota bacterium]
MKMLDVRQAWNGIEIRLRWFAYVYVFLLVIEVASIVALWYFEIFTTVVLQLGIMIADFKAFTDALSANSNEPIIMIFGALGALIMLFGTCCSPSRVLNSTVITATAEDIRVVHGPVPWAKGSTVPRGEFERFEVEQRAQRTKGGTTYYYRLMARRGDDAHKLAVYLQDEELARKAKDGLDRFYALTTSENQDS